MGIPITGVPLTWEEARDIAPDARVWATTQLLGLWHREKHNESYEPLWGDEIEYMLVALEKDLSRATVLLEQKRVLEECAVKEIRKQKLDACERYPTFQPEWASFMVESTPGQPYDGTLEGLLQVEPNMKKRRSLIKEHLSVHQHPMTITVFPRLGVPAQFTTPHFEPSPKGLRSRMLPNELCGDNIRSRILEGNIYARRQSRVETYVPVFRDARTPWPFEDVSRLDSLRQSPDMNTIPSPPNEGSIYLDGLGFGAASCCLQVTFQCKNEQEARFLYDQLIPLGSIMLALTAATPIHKGFLADTDVRWNHLSAGLDDRSSQELNEEPCSPPPRYSSNMTYISHDRRLLNEYHHPQLMVDAKVKQQLVDGGMDELLARHFSHILARDPIFLTTKDVENVSIDDTNIFEIFHCGVWQHVRFKPPPPEGGIGWRVEFRPMEVQLNDPDNAAFTVFMFLLSRAIIVFDLNFYIPIEKVTQSMNVAHTRDAVTKERFWFRRSGWSSDKLTNHQLSTNINRMEMFSQGGTNHLPTPCVTEKQPDISPYALMSVDEIINGESAKGATSASIASSEATRFPGLVSIIHAYLVQSNASASQYDCILPQLDLVSKRASGKLATPATWIRSFVRGHGNYQNDSVVSEEICFDLLEKISSINEE